MEEEVEEKVEEEEEEVEAEEAPDMLREEEGSLLFGLAPLLPPNFFISASRADFPFLAFFSLASLCFSCSARLSALDSLGFLVFAFFTLFGFAFANASALAFFSANFFSLADNGGAVVDEVSGIVVVVVVVGAEGGAVRGRGI